MDPEGDAADLDLDDAPSFFDQLPECILRKVIQSLLVAETISRAGRVSKTWHALVHDSRSLSRFRRLAEQLAADGPESEAARHAAALVDGKWNCDTLEGVLRWVDVTFASRWSVPAASLPAFDAALSTDLPAARALASWAQGRPCAGCPGECAALALSCARPADALRLLAAVERYARPTSGEAEPTFGRLAALELGSALLCVLLSDRYAYEFSQQAWALFEATQSLGSWLGSGEGPLQAGALTAEQQRVVDTDVPPGQLVKVIAFAGTGKTAVLEAFVRARPHLRFLYTCFNKSTREEMEGRLGGLAHVHVSTYHALAYASHGKILADKEKLIVDGGLTATDVKNVVCAAAPFARLGRSEQWEVARHVKEALVTFMSSADRELGRAHLSQEALRRDARTVDALIAAARGYWERMRNPADVAVRAVHDTYFKAWQLSGPDEGAPQILDREGQPYDYILLDEAQDSNPCFVHVFASQRAARIAVGDPHQQIYSFRLSVDALSALGAWRTLHLTRSFRFGAGVAGVASLLLRRFKREVHPVRGRPGDEPDCVLAPKTNAELKRLKWRPVQGRYTYLARSNARLFKEAAQLALDNPDIRLCFLGRDGPPALMRDVQDVYWLSIGDVWRMRQEGGPRFKRFNTMKELKEYAEGAQDIEAMRAIQVVEEHKGEIPAMIERVKAAVGASEEEADVLLSTVHQAKGREFDTVVLANDFRSCFEARAAPGAAEEAGQAARLLTPRELGQEPVSREEINVLYVAVTRARSRLVVPWTLHNLATRPLALAPRLGPAPAASCSLCWARRQHGSAEAAPAGRPPLRAAACGHAPLVDSERRPIAGGEPVGAGGACPCPQTHAPELARCLQAYARPEAPPPLAPPAPPTPSRARALFQAAIAASSPQAQSPADGPSSAPRRRSRAAGAQEERGARRRLNY